MEKFICCLLKERVRKIKFRGMTKEGKWSGNEKMRNEKTDNKPYFNNGPITFKLVISRMPDECS